MESKGSKRKMLSLLLARLVSCSTVNEADGETKDLGHIGAAILGSKTSKYYELVLYKGTNQYLQRIEIDRHFKFNIDAADTASLRDEHNVKWVLQYQSKTHLSEFASHIGLSRWIVSDMSTVLVQDMPASKPFYLEHETENQQTLAKYGDYVEIYYSAKIITKKHLFGIEVANNFNDGRPLVSKISTEWDKGLIGATPGSRRLLIIPNQCLGIWKCLVPDCQHLSLLVKVLRFGESESKFEMWKGIPDIQSSVPANDHTRVCRPGHGPGPPPKLLFDTLTQMKVHNAKMKEYASQMQLRDSEMRSNAEKLLKMNLQTIQMLEEIVIQNSEKKNACHCYVEHPGVKEMHGISDIEDELNMHNFSANHTYQANVETNSTKNDTEVLVTPIDVLPEINEL